MRIQTARDFGVLLREERRKRKLTQEAVARELGVTRQWVAGLERGKARADIGVFLRAVRVLGLTLSLDAETPAAAGLGLPDIDLDEIVDEARRGRR